MFKTLSFRSDLPDLGVLSSADFEDEPVDFEDEQTSILNYQKAYCDFLKLYAKVNRLKVPFSNEAFQEYKQAYKHNKLINKNSYYISEFSKINVDPVYHELSLIAKSFFDSDRVENQAGMYKFMTKFLNQKKQQVLHEINSKNDSTNYSARYKRKQNKFCQEKITYNLNKDGEIKPDKQNVKRFKTQTQDKFKLTKEMIAFVNKYSDERPAKIASRLKTKFNIPVNIELKAEIEALVNVSK